MESADRRADRGEVWRQRAERVRDAFGLVLFLVLLTYVLASLLDNRGWSAVVLTLATSATSIVALASSHVRRQVVRASLWLSALTIVLAAGAAVSDEQTLLNLASLIQICLLAVAMTAVLWRVVSGAEVGSRTILGAISVYAVLLRRGRPSQRQRLHLLQLYDADHHRLRQPRPRRPAGTDDRRAGDDARPDLPRHPGRRAGQPLAAGRRVAAAARAPRVERDRLGAIIPRRARPVRSSAPPAACRRRRSGPTRLRRRRPCRRSPRRRPCACRRATVPPRW